MRTTENEFAARRQHYELLRQAVRAYGFAPGTMIRIGSGYRVEGPAGPRFLKRLNYGPQEACFIYHALEHLRRNGFAEAPRMHLTTDGVPFIVPDGELFYLQDWHDLTAPDLSDPSALGSSVDLMVRLHKAGEGFVPPDDIRDVRNEYGSWLDKCVGRLREMYAFSELAEDGKQKSGFDQRYSRASLYFARQAEESVRRLAELPVAEVARHERHAKALCHRDFTPRNLALDGKSRLRVVDFDNVAREIRLDDVAKFLRRAAYLDIDRAAFVVERYGREMGHPLSSEELALISAYLLFPSEFWSVGNSRFRKDRQRERTLRRLIRDSEAWASFADALRDLNVPRGELLLGADGGAAAGRTRFPEQIALPEGPRLPSVAFAGKEISQVTMPKVELVRFDRESTQPIQDQEEVAANVVWPESWNYAPLQPEQTDTPTDGDTQQTAYGTEEEIWTGAQLPEGAEPWIAPEEAVAAEGGPPAGLPDELVAAVNQPEEAVEAVVRPADPYAGAGEETGSEEAGDYVQARRQLITSATTIVWGKWPKPIEKASGGGQEV